MSPTAAGTVVDDTTGAAEVVATTEATMIVDTVVVGVVDTAVATTTGVEAATTTGVEVATTTGVEVATTTDVEVATTTGVEGTTTGMTDVVATMTAETTGVTMIVDKPRYLTDTSIPFNPLQSSIRERTLAHYGASQLQFHFIA